MNSRDYWMQRETEALKNRITEESEYDKEIHRIYQDMLDNCQKEIDSFYAKYANKEGISIAEAKKRVSKLDIAAYERKAKRYVRDKDFSKQANEEMRLYNATMKINRLEMLKANIGLELISGHDELEKFMGGILKGRTEDELARQAGILGKTVRNNAQKAHAIVNGSFHNGTFSDRIWQYQDLMREDLGKLLQQGLIQGKNPRAIAKDLKKYWYGNDPKTGGGATYCMERLMRTELARVQTEAQKQSFQRNEFTHYEFLCNHNGNTCSICSSLDGKHFRVDKMMPGENAPPMHPHCRCSTAAWEDSDDYEAWLDYLSKGGTTAVWEKLSPAAKEKFKKSLTIPDSSSKIKPKISDGAKKLTEALEKAGVDYNKVTMHGTPLSESDIIKALAGGDRTRGSCASVGLAYIGQKKGMNVLDFRDGASRLFFSKGGNLKQIARLPNSGAIFEKAKSSLTIGNKLLKKVEKGKEYYLCVGRHAAIVRKTDAGVLQYLELQSQDRSGWTDFNGNPKYTLSKRFGCSSRGYGFEMEDFMIDIDEFKATDDLQEILGYINTSAGEQRKGVGGNVK